MQKPHILANWPHTTIYLSITKCILLKFAPVALLSILLFAFIFLLLFYSKIGLSLLLNQIVQPCLILLDSVCMCGVLKFKPTIENCHTINCIVCCKIQVNALVFSHLLFRIPNRSTLDFMFVLADMHFLEVSSIMLEISPIMLALCFMHSSPIIPKIDISCQHNQLKPSENPSCLHAKFILILEVQNHVTL